MRLTIYQLEHSPYCIPISRALGALGVEFDERNVANGDRREIIELTNGAYYQVPVLAHDGKVIFEASPTSIDVARYVNKTFAGGRLFPPEFEGLQRIVISYIEDNVESVTFKLVDPFYLRDIDDPIERAMIRRHKERKFGPGCEEHWLQSARRVVQPRPSAFSSLSTSASPGNHFCSVMLRSTAISRSSECSVI